jgi:hypothetical protein
MHMALENRKKTSLLINPSFQWHIIGYAAVMSGLILASVYGLLAFAFHQFVKVGIDAGLAPDHPYFQFIQMEESAFYRIVLAIALVTGILLFLGGLLLSHRIAGPILRMQNELEHAAKTEPFKLQEIQFRKNDYFPELALAFNNLVVNWKKNR